MQIDHNPHERRLGNGIYWILAIMLIALWAIYLTFNTPDFWALCIGGGTAAIVVIWGIEMTGNKVPDSWRKTTHGRPRR